MNLGRETILAGVVGFAVGLLAAWAVWSIPQIAPKREKEIQPVTVQEETTPKPAETLTLALTQPEDETISTNDEVQVSGKTAAGATVIVSGPLAEEVIEARSDGTFSTTVSLEEGANEIVVTAYPPAGELGEEKTETRTVNFTKEEF